MSSAPTSLKDHLDRLAAFEPVSSPVVSLYLDLRPNERGRDHYAAFVRKSLNERLARLEPRSSGRESLERDAARITTYLRDELKPSSNGLALFACATAGGFFDPIQLDAPIDQHWLFTGAVPHLYPLARLVDQYPRYAAVLLDTHRTRIMVFGLDTGPSASTVTTDKPRRSHGGGWSQARYQRRTDNLRTQHIKEVVDTLERIVAAERLSRLVVVGDDVVVGRFRANLPSTLEALVVDVINLDGSAPETVILKATLEALRGRDARSDAERTAELLGAWRAGGLAVAGPDATLAALERGQLDELLITGTPAALLPALSTAVPGEADVDVETSAGHPAPARSQLVIADHLVTRARQTGARITFIEDPDLLASVGGVGGFLRFAL